MRWFFLLAIAANAATIENYYQVLGLDKQTVLCDSRNSGCEEYREGISEFPEVRPYDTFNLYVDEQGFQAWANFPSSIVNTRQDVYVHQVVSFADSALLWYRYTGGQAGTRFSALWESQQCIETGQGVPYATATYSLDASVPTAIGSGCQMGEEALVDAVFGTIYTMKVDYSARYDVLLGPDTTDLCVACLPQSFVSASRFGGGYTKDGDFLQVEIVPSAHAPEPSSWLLLGSGALLVIGRRSIARGRSR